VIALPAAHSQRFEAISEPEASGWPQRRLREKLNGERYHVRSRTASTAIDCASVLSHEAIRFACDRRVRPLTSTGGRAGPSTPDIAPFGAGERTGERARNVLQIPGSCAVSKTVLASGSSRRGLKSLPLRYCRSAFGAGRSLACVARGAVPMQRRGPCATEALSRVPAVTGETTAGMTAVSVHRRRVLHGSP